MAPPKAPADLGTKREIMLYLQMHPVRGRVSARAPADSRKPRRTEGWESQGREVKHITEGPATTGTNAAGTSAALSPRTPEGRSRPVCSQTLSRNTLSPRPRRAPGSSCHRLAGASTRTVGWAGAKALAGIELPDCRGCRDVACMSHVMYACRLR